MVTRQYSQGVYGVSSLDGAETDFFNCYLSSNFVNLCYLKYHRK